jgi:hypothetical protein
MAGECRGDTGAKMMERYKLEIVNNHGDRYIRCEPAPDGSWVMFKDVVALQKKGCARDQTTTQYCAEAVALQARVAELEGALRNIAADCESDCPPSHGVIKYAARAALTGGKDE